MILRDGDRRELTREQYLFWPSTDNIGRKFLFYQRRQQRPPIYRPRVTYEPVKLKGNKGMAIL